jgi:hypothetical protein
MLGFKEWNNSVCCFDGCLLGMEGEGLVLRLGLAFNKEDNSVGGLLLLLK